MSTEVFDLVTFTHPILPSNEEMTQAQASLNLLKQDKADKHFAIGNPRGLKVPFS